MTEPLHLTTTLDGLAELYAQRDALAADYNRQIAVLEAQRAAVTAEVTTAIEQTESLIRAAVLQGAQTVKASRLTAVYVGPKTTWDGNKLIGYAAAHPEVLAFAKVGQPSVQLRWHG